MIRRVGLSPALAVALILLLAAALRVVFFVGLVSGDPQDDGVYYGYAYGIYQSGTSYFELFRNRPPDELANPIVQFYLRPMVIYPIAASFAVFGPGEHAAALWGFICSLGVVWVVYRLATVAHDHQTGLIAAFLCAIYPVEIINATRILSDVQVGLFFALGLLLILEGSRRHSLRRYAFAGAAAAAAYLANARGLMALGVFIGCAGLQAWRRETSWRAPALVAAGFLAIFTIEAAIYYAQTGDPLLNYRIHAEATELKYLTEPVESWRWWRLQIQYTNGRPLELISTVFLLTDLPTTQFGIFFFLFLPVALISLWRRRNLLLLLVCAVMFAYLEFGPVRLRYDAEAGVLQYSMIYKQPRFLLILTAPLMVIAADALRALWDRTRAVSALIVVLLVATSLNATMRTRTFYRSGLEDLRAITDFVKTNGDITFWSDLWAIGHLRMFTRYSVPNLRVLDVSTPIDHLRGSCVIVGGSRGVELLSTYVESTLPPFVQGVIRRGEVPPDWVLAREVRGQVTVQRSRDLLVYCVP